MRVMKFGGKSISTPQKMEAVADIVLNSPGKKIIVFSAISGTTKTLHSICDLLAVNHKNEAKEKIDELFIFYRSYVSKLFPDELYLQSAMTVLEEQFHYIKYVLKLPFHHLLKPDLLSHGEVLSSKLFSILLSCREVKHMLIPAIEFMHLDKQRKPMLGTIKVKLTQLINKNAFDISLTQGYLTLNNKNEIDNLGKGGGDLSAAIIASVLSADTCELWTDADEMRNIDATIVDTTNAVTEMDFEEAAELAYFGPKIIHPSSIWPAKEAGIPVVIKNTNNPEKPGTTIKLHTEHKGLRVIACRDKITSLRITNSDMLLAHGFLNKAFTIFEHYKTAVDMVTTSEIGLYVTIDDITHLKAIKETIETFSQLQVKQNQCILSLVGHNITKTGNLFSNVFTALNGIPVEMISYGGSENNLSIVIDGDYKTEAIKALEKALF